MKKIKIVLLGIVSVGVLSFGMNSLPGKQQASHADFPAPKQESFMNHNQENTFAVAGTKGTDLLPVTYYSHADVW
ncbi:Phr family secreted Rap phosphatase inhibitor [Bacillus sp. NPDC094106]|uniref:Phr family secreted Rap phosphatase inhibitor n=1 Tax=Bacillus sp. NPDC094106 TaxID=3363949 RepID=UPI0038018A33